MKLKIKKVNSLKAVKVERVVLLLLLLHSKPRSCSWGLRGQKVKIELPRITVFHHCHHFVWVKRFHPIFSVTIVIPMSSQSTNKHFPFYLVVM